MSQFPYNEKDYSQDIQALINENEGNPEIQEKLRELRHQKLHYLQNTDLQALIDYNQQQGNKAAVDYYTKLRTQKNELNKALGYQEPRNTGKTPDYLYDHGKAAIGDNTAAVKKDYRDAGNAVKDYAKHTETQANAQLQLAKQNAQTDAEEEKRKLYQRHNQQDIPAMQEAIANMGGSASSGFSRQEALNLQQGLAAERNALERQKNQIIAQAEAQARELIAKGKQEEANRLWETALSQAQAISQQRNQDIANALKLAQMEYDGVQKLEDRTHESIESEKDKIHDSQEAQKDREHKTQEGEKDREHKTQEGEKDREYKTQEGEKDREHKTQEGEKDREHDMILKIIDGMIKNGMSYQQIMNIFGQYI